jgi:hypothetical protein
VGVCQMPSNCDYPEVAKVRIFTFKGIMIFFFMFREKAKMSDILVG